MREKIGFGVRFFVDYATAKSILFRGGVQIFRGNLS